MDSIDVLPSLDPSAVPIGVHTLTVNGTAGVQVPYSLIGYDSGGLLQPIDEAHGLPITGSVVVSNFPATQPVRGQSAASRRRGNGCHPGGTLGEGDRVQHRRRSRIEPAEPSGGIEPRRPDCGRTPDRRDLLGRIGVDPQVFGDFRRCERINKRGRGGLGKAYSRPPISAPCERIRQCQVCFQWGGTDRPGRLPVRAGGGADGRGRVLSGWAFPNGRWRTPGAEPLWRRRGRGRSGLHRGLKMTAFLLITFFASANAGGITPGRCPSTISARVSAAGMPSVARVLVTIA